MGILSYVAGKLQSNGEEVTLASDKGLATAWVRFTTSGAVIDSSYNVLSVSTRGTGLWQVNFTTGTMDNSTYIMSGQGSGKHTIHQSGTYSTTADTAEIDVLNSSGALSNPAKISVVFHGGKA